MKWIRWIFAVTVVLAVTFLPRPTVVNAASGRYYSETGFAIDDAQLLDYFDKRGGVRSFGYPVSREFTFLGFPTQIFQRAVMQKYPDGHVQLLNLLDNGVFPYTQVNDAVFPGVDSTLVASAPAVGSSDYGAAILRWIAKVSPNQWQGLPVDFHQDFLATVSAGVAFP
ncbi:MAG TPA: hypothetical protein VMW65_16480, partial [Chloroflexota bacterium]|nr:hypothetical protein [Chloroflexota bacterium]